MRRPSRDALRVHRTVRGDWGFVPRRRRLQHVRPPRSERSFPARWDCGRHWRLRPDLDSGAERGPHARGHRQRVAQRRLGAKPCAHHGPDAKAQPPPRLQDRRCARALAGTAARPTHAPRHVQWQIGVPAALMAMSGATRTAAAVAATRTSPPVRLARPAALLAMRGADVPTAQTTEETRRTTTDSPGPRLRPPSQVKPPS